MNNFARRVALCQMLATVVASTACGSSSVPSGPTIPLAVSPPLRRIVVLGDSLAVSPSRTQNFPAELQQRLDAVVRGWTITNASVRGDTTSGGLRRFDEVVANDTEILLLELGANDGLRGVDIATIAGNLSTLIERAQALGIRVLLCGMETPPTHGWDYTIEYHRMFRRVAVKHDVPLVPFLLAGVAVNPEMNGSDSIHPNAAGARAIANNVWPYLEPLVQEVTAAATAVAQ